jgi:hypothetical protein
VLMLTGLQWQKLSDTKSMQKPAGKTRNMQMW